MGHGQGPVRRPVLRALHQGHGWLMFNKPASHEIPDTPYLVAVITLVGQHQLWVGDGHVDQVIDGLVVGGLAAGENEAERASLTVGAGVDFARKAAAASTKAFLRSPPFAPAAWLWPRTVVLSIMCCQSSARPSSTSVSSKASQTPCSAQ